MTEHQETYRNVFRCCGFLSKPGDTVTIYVDDCVVSVNVTFDKNGKIKSYQRIYSTSDTGLYNIYYSLEDLFHEAHEARKELE